ncbi:MULTISPECIES: hypothetical protein [unclassified Pseudomonas]|uniref:hypothetical protein n=1 Tax=unclassified Pseudomonas TaxID=196821 RepID=UPI002AC8DE01|nr:MULTISPECIES: hypothetical protein [unclassified Pseudomonas]MEB0042904.1 hypothetical protein [Pseudomonas sp. MH10]MEB0120368.1 hypothetical protein [Pseudomonas sp. CCI1.2]WPX65575.1 hypothetical protein RHM59_08010 [Pseudomonas sp. MH10]
MEEEQDEALMRVYTKHAGDDFETVRHQENDLLRASIEETFGVDLGDDLDLDSIEEVTQRLQEKLDEVAQESKHDGRQKPAKTVRQEEEPEKGSQSIRDSYRKLVSALHPDRETDTAERERKTEDLKMSFRMQFLLEPFAPIQPKNALRTCEKTIRAMRTDLLLKKNQLLTLSDTKILKAWLREQREIEEFSDWLDDDMSDGFFR